MKTKGSHRGEEPEGLNVNKFFEQYLTCVFCLIKAGAEAVDVDNSDLSHQRKGVYTQG